MVGQVTDNAEPHDILVVDDSPSTLRVFELMLAKRGYLVRTTPSGRVALELVAAKVPDLILLDVSMPDMDGYELCRCLKADDRSRDVPVIFISGLDDSDDMVKGFKVGGVDYITKKAGSEEVLARVETHLTLRQLRREMEEKNAALQKALDEIETLRGLLPICSSCKRVRDDEGCWQQIESYIAKHSEVTFSHSLCMDCASRLYPEIVDKTGNLRRS